MLKSDAEQMARRIIEEHGAQFTDEQITALAQIITKITGRMIEEAMASARSNKPGSPGGFFTQ